MIKLSEAAIIIMGQSPKGDSYNQNGDGYPLLNGAADYKGQIFNPKKFTNKPTRLAQKGDILLGIRATIGNFAFADRTYCIGRGVAAIRVDERIANRNYVQKCVEIELEKIIHTAAGSTIKGIKKEDLTDMLISLPPIETQRKIAAILDAADELRQKDKALIEKYTQLSQSLFLDMFGDPVSNPMSWPEISLQDVAVKTKNAIVDGPFGSSIKQNDYRENGVPLIRINNIRNDGYYNHEFKYITEEKYEKLIRSKVEYYDILIARVGNTIGKTCIFNQNYKALLSTTGVAKLTTNQNKYNVKFISKLMEISSYRKYIESLVQGAGQPYLNLSKIKSFKIINVPFNLQNQFADRVTEIEKQKQQAEAAYKKSEELFQSLLQRAFKGELV